MKCYIKHIGILDKSEKIHSVHFNKGVNIITGRSSTGKSAMIEIFDYCFGSSEFTIPSGVITEYSDLYFVVLSIKETNIILARRQASKKAFFKEETSFDDVNLLSLEYFEDRYFIGISDYKQLIGRYLGLNIESVDEDLKEKEFRGRAKERPSIRNMSSFMLQHQNLIANKHSIFYRFDEKEKREQTIDQFKIFSGFVNQNYFLIKQNLSDEERNLKRLKNEKILIEEKNKKNIEILDNLLKEFFVISGNQLFKDEIKVLLLSPVKTLDVLKNIKIDSNYESDESILQLKLLKEEKNKLYSEKRDFLIKMEDINSSIKYANEYKEHLNSLESNHGVKVHISECPFCKSVSDKIVNEANELSGAIEWLNSELSKTPYMLSSFETNQKEVVEEIKKIGEKILQTNSEIIKIEEINKKLKNNRNLEEQSLKVKLKIENFLENVIDNNTVLIDEKIKATEIEIERLKNKLKIDYNVNKKLLDAQNYINDTMKKIGAKFEFEKSYIPINLKFSLDSFELWHEKIDEKIFLRSMGSGANWLYSHITLFLSIHKYFCSLGNSSTIPPILFLDQPSQVYFPTSIKDDNEKFDAKEIEKKKGIGNADEDLVAVTNLFNQLVSFCKNTLDETGIEPQIIITDHADNLVLDEDNGVLFENLVDGRRWRKKGFIDDANLL